jgi:hypothetical protein
MLMARSRKKGELTGREGKRITHIRVGVEGTDGLYVRISKQSGRSGGIYLRLSFNAFSALSRRTYSFVTCAKPLIWPPFFIR